MVYTAKPWRRQHRAMEGSVGLQCCLGHTVPADGAVGEWHQAFWACDNKPLVLTTVTPHTDMLVVSTRTKAGLVTEDDLLASPVPVFGDVDVVLRTVVIMVCVHVVLRGAAVC